MKLFKYTIQEETKIQNENNLPIKKKTYRIIHGINPIIENTIQTIILSSLLVTFLLIPLSDLNYININENTIGAMFTINMLIVIPTIIIIVFNKSFLIDDLETKEEAKQYIKEHKKLTEE
jgi:hypothetical protein